MDLTGWDGLAGVEWLCPCVRSRVGFGDGPADVRVGGAAVEATCGMGDGSTPGFTVRAGFAVRAGCLLCGLAVALNGGCVPAQVACPQPPTPETGE